MYEIIKSINVYAKRFIISFILLYVFVMMSMYIFKPTLFKEIIYLPFIICFCLTFVSFFLSLITISSHNPNENKHNEIVQEFIAIVGICIVGLSTLIAYYYSFSFTRFLLLTFIIHLIIFIFMFFKGVTKEFKKNMKKL